MTVTKHRVRGPAHTHPGFAKVHIVSWTGQRANVLIFRPRLHQTNTRLAKDLTAFSSTSSPKQLQHDFRNVGGADTGSTMYLHLRKGTYFAVVPRNGVVKRSSVYRLRVYGKAQNARNPQSSAVISTGTHKVKWAPKPVSMPRSGVVKFVNRGHVVSDLYIEQLKKGVTLADVRRWFVDPKQQKPSPFTSHYVALGALSPHTYEKLVYKAPAGKYVLVNFWVDYNGDPIALQGMLRAIHLV